MPEASDRASEQPSFQPHGCNTRIGCHALSASHCPSGDSRLECIHQADVAFNKQLTKKSFAK